MVPINRKEVNVDVRISFRYIVKIVFHVTTVKSCGHEGRFLSISSGSLKLKRILFLRYSANMRGLALEGSYQDRVSVNARLTGAVVPSCHRAVIP